MYLSDLHFHTLCSSDSPATLAQQAEAAMAAGLREICVTDHWNLLDQQGNRLPTVYDWGPSLDQWRALRDRWPGKLELRLGVEVGNGVLDPAAAWNCPSWTSSSAPSTAKAPKPGAGASSPPPARVPPERTARPFWRTIWTCWRIWCKPRAGTCWAT